MNALSTSAPFLWPWLDRKGRLSALKLVAFVSVLLPALWILAQWQAGWLGSKPVTEAIHQSGQWAVRLLLATLAVTPLRFVGNWPKLFLVRRMLGVSVLFYVLLHLLLYFVQEAYDLWKVASEIVLRFYLTIGFIALCGLAALGATSTDAMIRRLGPRWHRLHWLVHPIAVLALLHFFIQRKINVTEAVFMTGLFMLAWSYRLLRRYGFALAAPLLATTAIVAGALTMIVESAWYGLATGVPALAVLKANLDFSYEVRPGWWVAAVGAGVGALAAVRAVKKNRSGARPKSAGSEGVA